MISVIVSTYQSHFLESLKKNIAETIGVEYEIVAIENKAQYSICEVYNMGVEQAKYDFFCFVHEDVLFDTKDWGKSLISRFKKDSSIGLLGVAGSQFKSSYPSAWGQGPCLSQYKRGHIFQKIDKEYCYLEFDESVQKQILDDVVFLDGVLLFTKKEVLTECKFDDTLLKNFHGYDIDFSLQVFFKGYRIVVDRELIIYHASSGNYDKNNTIANRIIAKKWWKKLPVTTKNTSLSWLQIKILDLRNWQYFIFTALKRKLFFN